MDTSKNQKLPFSFSPIPFFIGSQYWPLSSQIFFFVFNHTYVHTHKTHSFCADVFIKNAVCNFYAVHNLYMFLSKIKHGQLL